MQLAPSFSIIFRVPPWAQDHLLRKSMKTLALESLGCHGPTVSCCERDVMGQHCQLWVTEAWNSEGHASEPRTGTCTQG